MIQLLESAPAYLRERTRWVHTPSTSAAHSEGTLWGVLYWMHHALRVEENPALDLASWLAVQLRQPLVVYWGLSDDYPFASDRHHRLMLEGAREVQRELGQRQIPAVFHLATADDRRPLLRELASQVTCLVTEDFPVSPIPEYLQRVRSRVEVPILAVDTACVVPRSILQRASTRAFEFRQRFANEYEKRTALPWPKPQWDGGSAPDEFSPEKLELPKSLDLDQIDLDSLIGRCRIDHSIPPVADTPGGSSAGYARWNAFMQGPLRRYARDRNDALLPAVSRMSAYLHYGMVSPFRLAREAASCGGAGAEKYLDELLIWREMAYAFCYFREDFADWTALPDWAQRTLEEHAADHRDSTYTWEELARGTTHDLLWNAAQHSLLHNGELHNNVRMTWGKAVLNWVQSPRQAFEWLVDLNHRYALDGRDPASYGGLLWCFGQFDRPFTPPQPIFGTVRTRPTEIHAERLPVTAYRAQILSRRPKPRPSVAVIGAGLAGLMAARCLADQGFPIQVFDKGRGVGGRMSTRRVLDDLRFDHGAQYFTRRDQRLHRWWESWERRGLIAPWPRSSETTVSEESTLAHTAANGIVILEPERPPTPAPPQPRWVGVPGMSAVAKHLADGLSTNCETRVARAVRVSERWQLISEAGVELGTFDRLIVAIPPEQAAEVLAEFPEVASRCQKVMMQPCWAALVAFDNPLKLDWSGAFIHHSFLAWAARNHTKPHRRTDREQLVLHATPQWTAAHWERPSTEVADEMLREFFRVIGAPPVTPTNIQGHRWKYANVSEQTIESTEAWYDADLNLSLCGDWAAGGRVEGALISGMAAAGHLLRREAS